MRHDIMNRFTLVGADGFKLSKKIPFVCELKWFCFSIKLKKVRTKAGPSAPDIRTSWTLEHHILQTQTILLTNYSTRFQTNININFFFSTAVNLPWSKVYTPCWFKRHVSVSKITESKINHTAELFHLSVKWQRRKKKRKTINIFSSLKYPVCISIHTLL